MEIKLEDLPESIRNQIAALHEPKKEMFPIAPREFSVQNFQTKEIQELGKKMDELINALNFLHEKGMSTPKPTHNKGNVN